MNNLSPTGPNWTTASLGGSADTSMNELAALQDHLGMCQAMRGRLFHLQRQAESALSFAASRLVTTLLAVILLGGLIWVL